MGSVKRTTGHEDVSWTEEQWAEYREQLAATIVDDLERLEEERESMRKIHGPEAVDAAASATFTIAYKRILLKTVLQIDSQEFFDTLIEEGATANELALIHDSVELSTQEDELETLPDEQETT